MGLASGALELQVRTHWLQAFSVGFAHTSSTHVGFVHVSFAHIGFAHIGSTRFACVGFAHFAYIGFACFACIGFVRVPTVPRFWRWNEWEIN